MPIIRLAGSLPDGDANGMLPVVNHLIEHPHRMHVAVVLVDCARTATNHDTGEVVPTARVRRVEVITDLDDGKRLVDVMERAFARRTGQAVLPLDLQDDIAGIFSRFDPETGEFRDESDLPR